MLKAIKVISAITGVIITLNVVHYLVGYFIETVPVDVQAFLIFTGFMTAIAVAGWAFFRFVK